MAICHRYLIDKVKVSVEVYFLFCGWNGTVGVNTLRLRNVLCVQATWFRSLKIMRWLLNRYLRLLETHPWKTTCISTGILVGTGDVISQQAIEKRGWMHHDKRRNLKMTGLGVFLMAPAQRKMYMTLEQVLPGTRGLTVVKKMLVTQVFWAPFIIGAIFFLSDVIDGKTRDEIEKKFATSYLSTLKVGYMIWPGMQLIIFYFIPLQHRVLFMNVVALFWNTYLTWVVNKEKNE